MKLTDTKVRNAKANPDKTTYLYDGGGLRLAVLRTGWKSWQLKYTLARKAKLATLGEYPTMGLAEAREAARLGRAKVALGVHLTAEKRASKATKIAAQAATFEVVAADWVEDEAKRQRWSDDHKKKVQASIRRHLLDPDVKGGRGLRGVPVESITAATCKPILNAAETRAPVLALKVRQRLHGILDKAVEDGLIVVNPLPKTRRGSRAERKNLPAVLDHKGVGEILRAADAAQTRCSGMKRAHLLATFTAQRIQTVVQAEWSSVDLVAGTWTIGRDAMKKKDAMRGAHVVPLPPGLLATMKEWKRADGDRAKWVCPNESGDAPVTREGVEVFYRRKLGLNGRHSPHSWRTVLKTWSAEAGEDNEVVRAQMDHVKRDRTEAAYDRSTRLEQRRVLMARHEERLLAARDGRKAVSTNVVALRGTA